MDRSVCAEYLIPLHNANMHEYILYIHIYMRTNTFVWVVKGLYPPDNLQGLLLVQYAN